jgi:molecular chaperone HscA
LLNAEERADIDRHIASLAAAMTGEDHRAIRQHTETLDLATKPFAERRMNQQINAAIGGHQVEEIEEKVQHAKGTEAHEGTR